MSYENIYYRTKDWIAFHSVVSKKHPKLSRKVINTYYNKIKQVVGKQENLKKNYKRKYQYEFSYTTSRADFIRACRSRFRTDSVSNITKRYYEIKKRQKEFVEEVIKLTELPSVPKENIKKRVNPEELDDDSLVPLNEIEEPSPMKMMEINDMKRLGFKITEVFLRKHGFNRFEINWLMYKKIVR